MCVYIRKKNKKKKKKKIFFFLKNPPKKKKKAKKFFFPCCQRNRLTHFYADVTPEEIYKVITVHLDDFNTFLQAIKDLMKNPEKFNLTIE